MARYRTTALSGVAIGADSAFFFLMSIAGNGFSLRRVTATPFTSGSSAAPPDQDMTLGIAPTTSGGTGAGTAQTVTKLKPIFATNNAIATTGFATINPSFGAATADAHRFAISSRGGYEAVWEPPQEFDVNSGTANGLAFINRANALTTPLAWLIDVEWEE